MSLWQKIKSFFVKSVEKTKEKLMLLWISAKPELIKFGDKSKKIITKEVMRIAKKAVINIAENRKDLLSDDDGRRHAAQDEFKKMLEEETDLSKDDIKDSLINAALEMAVIEIKF